VLALPPRGCLIIDAGAAAAIERGNSLFPAGVISVGAGLFAEREAVRLLSKDGREVARAVVNYNWHACGAPD